MSKFDLKVNKNIEVDSFSKFFIEKRMHRDFNSILYSSGYQRTKVEVKNKYSDCKELSFNI